jgi:two-component system, OmpR family, copper resistance phosphate regulon response regulator CusR
MRILVVEDEKGIGNFLRDGLQEEGFAVDVAEDGKKGLEFSRINEYDMILLDWMLPGLSGIEVCRSIRKFNTSVPIMYLTAKDTVQDTIFGLESGANDYMKKPFAFEELLARIRVQLRSKDAESAHFTVGDIVLDVNTRTVLKNNINVPFTQKEFSLLEFLLRNKNKVCTRTRIIEHVWDIHFDADTSVIDVYINALRKKLTNPKGNGYIHTIRGVGYIVRDP